MTDAPRPRDLLARAAQRLAQLPICSGFVRDETMWERDVCRECGMSGDTHLLRDLWARVESAEKDIIEQATVHWFTQGGEADFGALVIDPVTADTLIAQVLSSVRARIAALEQEQREMQIERAQVGVRHSRAVERAEAAEQERDAYAGKLHRLQAQGSGRPAQDFTDAQSEPGSVLQRPMTDEEMDQLQYGVAYRDVSGRSAPLVAQAGVHDYQPDEHGRCTGCGGEGYDSHWGHQINWRPIRQEREEDEG